MILVILVVITPAIAAPVTVTAITAAIARFFVCLDHLILISEVSIVKNWFNRGLSMIVEEYVDPILANT